MNCASNKDQTVCQWQLAYQATETVVHWRSLLHEVERNFRVNMRPYRSPSRARKSPRT